MGPNDTYATWLVNLKDKARLCRFFNQTITNECQAIEERIRDHIVMKTPHDHVRNTMLQMENPTLDDLMRVCKTCIDTGHTAASSMSIDRIRRTEFGEHIGEPTLHPAKVLKTYGGQVLQSIGKCLNYAEVFDPGTPHVKDYEVELTIDTNAIPHCWGSRRVPFSLRESVEAELQRQLKQGVIEPVDTSQEIVDWDGSGFTDIPVCLSAFEKVKESLMDARILKNFDIHKDVHLTCDASDNGLGAILFQEDQNHVKLPYINLNETIALQTCFRVLIKSDNEFSN
ncbi:hypothetical protein GJ496_003528 [Pomphorhynchus laevis]|nr:hypothetical protein GJ496_003528 [Pomphorhynchus laevis]